MKVTDRTLTVSRAQAGLPKLCNSGQSYLITNRDQPTAVLLPIGDYEALIETLDLLANLNSHIFRSFKYVPRDEPGVQLPSETIARGSGSCRDYAVLMMEAARRWGFAARFVTGYIQMAEGQHGATHAWTEIYVPGSGWLGFDPTNNKPVGREHIAVAVAREQVRLFEADAPGYRPSVRLALCHRTGASMESSADTGRPAATLVPPPEVRTSSSARAKM